jgi:hypothetical protein
VGILPLSVARSVRPTPSGPYLFNCAQRPRCLAGSPTLGDTSSPLLAYVGYPRLRVTSLGALLASPSDQKPSFRITQSCLQPRRNGPLWRHDHHTPSTIRHTTTLCRRKPAHERRSPLGREIRSDFRGSSLCSLPATSTPAVKPRYAPASR